ncbi:MAG TPA: hypothetical protein VN285_10795 [Candidatus Deferrimicrobium sp.]|nr:hypothetical protein [Candidatus Deferrimicrobium sp.]
MKPKVLMILCATALLMAAGAGAQVDFLGLTDTLYADIAKVNDFNWTITISFSNDEAVAGLTVPLKLSAGMARIVADSAIYAGGRAEKFAYKGFRSDSALGCVLLGMIANMGPTQNQLIAGKGRLATIFVSSRDRKPIEKLTVDTTTLSPNNSLMAVADLSAMKALQDTIPAHMSKKREIIPAFLARQVK